MALAKSIYGTVGHLGFLVISPLSFASLFFVVVVVVVVFFFTDCFWQRFFQSNFDIFCPSLFS